MQKLFRSLIAVAGLASLAACGDDVSITAPNDPLVITGAPVTAVSVGAKVQLSASEAASWVSSAANVATVDATGLVTAVAAGTASITATATADATKKATVTITVSSAVRSVTVQPATAVLIPGGTLGFVANVDRDAGVAGTVTWTSSNTAVATVSSAGVVTAVTVGSATITAAATAAPTVTGSAVVTVRQPTPATISIQNITQAFTAGSPTINNNNVAGAIDVNMNVDPGEQVVTRAEVLIDGVVACFQNLSPAQSEAMRQAAAFEEIQDVIVSCQINTAAFSATTGVATYFNGSRVISARAVITGGNDVATPSTPLIFNNVSGVIATLTNDNAPDPNSAIHPTSGLQWIGGSVSLKLIGVSYVSGTTVASVNCTIFGKDAFNFVLASGTVTQVYSGSSTWSSTDKDLNGYLTPNASATTGESVICPSAVLSNGDPMPVPTGSTLLNFGPSPGQTTNAAQPALQFVRVDNVAPGAVPANTGIGNTQAVLALSALPSVWVNAATSFAVGTSTNAAGVPAGSVLNSLTTGTGNDIEEGVDAIVVTVNVPAAGGTLPTGTGCPLTGLTAVTTGSQLAETTVSTAYPMRITFTDALGNRTCLDQASIGADFVAPTIVSVTGPTANSFFTSQAAVTDFSFSVTDNASGFGATPIRVSIVRLDSANTAFCVLGGTSCATTNAALTFDATNSLTNSGYYTITYAVRDQAGNTTGTTTVTYLLDSVLPTWSGGVSLPSVIAGATTNTFTATPSDNLDLNNVFGLVDYPTLDLLYPNQSLGTYGAPLSMGGTSIGYAVANWIRCVNNAADFATTTNQPTTINLAVTDQAGNGASLLSPVFGANAQPCGAVGATAINTFGPTVATLAATKTEVDIDGANLATTSATTAALTAVADVPLNTAADPFARVEFYYEAAPGSNIWRLAGTSTGVLAQTPTTRTYTYSFTWDPDALVPSAALPGASVNVMAIGVDAQGDAVRTATAAVLIVP